MSDQTATTTTTPETGAASPAALTAGEGAAPMAQPPAPVLSDLDLPAQIRAAYDQRGMSETGHNHAKVSRRFLEWLQDRGQNLGSMPTTAVEEYLNGIDNPVTRNVAASAIRVLFDTCLTVGHKYVAQPVNRVRVPSGKKRVQTSSPAAVAGAAPTAPGAAPAPVVPLPLIHGSAAQSVAAAAAVTPSVDPGALAQARPLPTRRPTTGVPSLGGRIRVSKRLDGSEGLGLPVGSRVFIGEYTADDLDGEGSVARFIASYIRPKHGPWAGGRPATYIVERLDNVGNPMAGGALDVAVMPGEDPAPSTPSVPPPQPQVTPMSAPQSAAPAAPAPAPNERFLDFLMEERRRSEEKYEKALAAIKEQSKGGMDAATLMLLTEKLRPEPIDLAAAAKAFATAQGKPETPALPPPAPVALPSQPVMPPMGLGGFDPFGPPVPPRADPTVEALLAQVKDLTAKVTDMATKTAAPPPADPMAMMTTLLTAAKALQPPPPPPPPANPIMDQLAGITLQRLSQEPKTKTLAETLSDLRAVQQFMGGGEANGPSAGEVIVELINNADKLGEFIGKMKAGAMAPPTLPTRQPAQAALPAQPGPVPQKSPTPPLPDAAKQAIVALWKAPEDAEQEIVANLWNLLTTLMQAPEPWPMVAKRVMEGFIAADSKPEIRAIVTQLMVWCGAKRSMTEAGIEKIVTVLHRHYTLIYAQMKGGEQKTLKDAEGTPAAEAGSEAPEAEAQAGVEVEEVGGEDEEQDDTEQDDEWGATPTEGAQA